MARTAGGAAGRLRRSGRRGRPRRQPGLPHLQRSVQRRFGGPYSPGARASRPASRRPRREYRPPLDPVRLQPAVVPGDSSRIEVDFGRGRHRPQQLHGHRVDAPAASVSPSTSRPRRRLHCRQSSPTTFPNDWRELVDGIDSTAPHDMELRLTYVDGPNNDVIEVYLDGNLIGTTTTFENFRDAVAPVRAHATPTTPKPTRPTASSSARATTASRRTAPAPARTRASISTTSAARSTTTPTAPATRRQHHHRQQRRQHAERSRRQRRPDRGDDGDDTAIFSGNRANYNVDLLGNGGIVVTDLVGARPDGTDAAREIENFQFAADGIVLERQRTCSAIPPVLAIRSRTRQSNRDTFFQSVRGRLVSRPGQRPLVLHGDPGRTTTRCRRGSLQSGRARSPARLPLELLRSLEVKVRRRERRFGNASDILDLVI